MIGAWSLGGIPAASMRDSAVMMRMPCVVLCAVALDRKTSIGAWEWTAVDQLHIAVNDPQGRRVPPLRKLLRKLCASSRVTRLSCKWTQPTRITEEHLASLDLPVLAIIAGESVMHDPEVAEATARRTLADGNVLVVPGASHAINGEHPNEIAAAITRFLEDDRYGESGPGSR